MSAFELPAENQRLIDLFPFEYVGGGYFREKGVDKGKPAQIIHGGEILKTFLLYLLQDENGAL